MSHQVFYPDAISAEGDSKTGNLHLFYRMPNGETIAVVLPPDLLGKTIAHLATGVLQSPNPETKALAQLFAIRNISASLHPPSLLTMKYEVEAGAVMETTIDRSDAQRLCDQLSSALAASQNAASNQKH